jgi:hypothetical protein
MGWYFQRRAAISARLFLCLEAENREKPCALGQKNRCQVSKSPVFDRSCLRTLRIRVLYGLSQMGPGIDILKIEEQLWGAVSSEGDEVGSKENGEQEGGS